MNRKVRILIAVNAVLLLGLTGLGTAVVLHQPSAPASPVVAEPTPAPLSPEERERILAPDVITPLLTGSDEALIAGDFTTALSLLEEARKAFQEAGDTQQVEAMDRAIVNVTAQRDAGLAPSGDGQQDTSEEQAPED